MTPSEMTPALPIHELHLQSDTVDFAELTRGVRTEVTQQCPDSGPRALMRAILHEAVLCLQGTAAGVRLCDRAAVAEQARTWMRSRSARWIFSFESICQVLDIDPDFLRRKLLGARVVDAHARPRYRRTQHYSLIRVQHSARARNKRPAETARALHGRSRRPIQELQAGRDGRDVGRATDVR